MTATTASLSIPSAAASRAEVFVRLSVAPLEKAVLIAMRSCEQRLFSMPRQYATRMVALSMQIKRGRQRFGTTVPGAVPLEQYTIGMTLSGAPCYSQTRGENHADDPKREARPPAHPGRQ